MVKFNFKPKKVWKVPSEGQHLAFVVAYLQPFVAEDMEGNPYEATRFVLELDEYLDPVKKDKHLVVFSKNIRMDSMHPKSNLFLMAKAALGRVPKDGEITSPTDLVGKFVNVILEHNQAKDGRIFANTKTVFAAKPSPETDAWVSTYETENENIIVPSEEELAHTPTVTPV